MVWLITSIIFYSFILHILCYTHLFAIIESESISALPVDLQNSSCISFFSVKIDKDKQLVILEEEHEVSFLLDHVKSCLSQVGD